MRSCLIPHLRVVQTRKLETLVTALLLARSLFQGLSKPARLATRLTENEFSQSTE